MTMRQYQRQENMVGGDEIMINATVAILILGKRVALPSRPCDHPESAPKGLDTDQNVVGKRLVGTNSQAAA